MEENQKQAIQWIKDQKIKGALTGSCLLKYFEYIILIGFVF